MTMEVSHCSEIDDVVRHDSESLAWEKQPVPSIAELAALQQVRQQPLNIITVSQNGSCKGMAICSVEHAERVHGIRNLKVMRMFGYDLFDYSAIHAKNDAALKSLLNELGAEAKRAGADLILLSNLVNPATHPDMLIKESCSTHLFDADHSDTGFDWLLKKKSLRRHWNKMRRELDYRCEHFRGNDPGFFRELEALAPLHISRWAHDGVESAFIDPLRIQEYAAAPENKLITVIKDGDTIVATHFGIIFDDVLLWHTPVVNVDYFNYSPLEALLFETAELCKSEEIRVLDFGLGDEAYKNRFSNESRPLTEIFVPISWKGRLCALLKGMVSWQRKSRCV